MRGRQPLAILVTAIGVVGVFVFASARQNEQTRTLGRRWVGERWDIARRCIVGTPVGRSDPESVVADRLVAVLFETLAGLEAEDEPPDLATAWPARCTPLLSRLHADRSVTGGDISRPLAELEVWLVRAIELDDVQRSVHNVRDLAGSVHALDLIMPAGAEYDPAHFESPSVRGRPIERSLAAPPRHEQAAGSEVGFLATSEVADGPPELPIPLDRPLRAAVRCGDAAWVVAEQPSGAEGTDAGDLRAYFVAAGGATRLRPTPPRDGVVWACDDGSAAFLWPDRGVGRTRVFAGIVCDADRCRPTPSVRARSVQVAVAGPHVHTVSRGQYSDLPLWRQLTRGRWTAPRPVPYGALSADERGILLQIPGRQFLYPSP